MKNDNGLSLIEASVVMVIGAVVISFVLLYYASVQENKKLTDSIELLQSVITSVQRTYASAPIPSEDPASLAVLIAKVGGYQLTDKKIQFPIGGKLELWGGDRLFWAEIQGFNMSECMRLSTLNLGTSMTDSPELLLSYTSLGHTEFDYAKANDLCTQALKGTGVRKLRFALRV
ncbi:TPA: prepilin-type N-terminal cleavage/methylation domain-containing protein [Escherichia coli]|nr:prepilin-type N-terminal cleavage/methylation domain-containing protein [Escherichia coli]HBA7008758.1 prepilin-type N-terminal cleavage/methylation domain-containing protein [Escherichia coli]HBA7958950.1 prepilin-type N-terminal cleavage/methylation domain-containing protein [Escherichia coli]HBA8246744.1 prepilin-type N-terminal cleavage/methylation domain-containing protein [Escherichia coli]HBA8544184.1 prepilin-type N-terminal cleavage/methylation domain-containing protein [Escherichia